MIKELISDLSFDKITLSQALQRAKIIAYKVDDQNFLNWIKLENQGYPVESEIIPDYRVIHCIVKVNNQDYYGNTQEMPVSFLDADQEIRETLTLLKISQSISTIEDNLSRVHNNIVYHNINPEQVVLLNNLFKHMNLNLNIVSAKQEIKTGDFKNIIDQTKNKLLDTLLELDRLFPNLENNFNPTKENKESVKNIITNNIYGNQNPLSIISGNDNELSGINYSFETTYKELEKLGVEKSDIESLKEILSQGKSEKSKPNLGIMKWLGNVSASLVSKGISGNYTSIVEYIDKII